MSSSTAVPTEVIEFGQSVGQLVRRIRAASGAHGLSWSESLVIARLDRHGPATTADLARAEGVKPQSMGTTVASLEEMGIVERKPHPTDGRQVHIQLTARGIELRRSSQDAKWTWLANAMSELNERERETLLAAGEIIKRLADS